MGANAPLGDNIDKNIPCGYSRHYDSFYFVPLHCIADYGAPRVTKCQGLLGPLALGSRSGVLAQASHH